MKILSVIGTRPQFIKAIPLSLKLQKSHIKECLIHTSQHYDPKLCMYEDLAKKFHLSPQIFPLKKYENQNTLTHMVEEICKILIKQNPDIVLVYGDTNSTLAGALAALYCNIPLGHIEAGLRSRTPMPEETNRVLTDKISHFLFTPSKLATKNLKEEGLHKKALLAEVGDVLLECKKLFEPYLIPPKLMDIQKREVSNKLYSPFILASIHRAENVPDPKDTHCKSREKIQSRFFHILDSINQIAQSHTLFFLTHPRNIPFLKKYMQHTKTSIIFLPPQEYLSSLYLLSQMEFLITDSGGLQREAFFFKKRALVIRDSSEWLELLDSGFHTLCFDPKNIPHSFDRILNSKHTILPPKEDLYGDGDVASKILQILEKNKGNLG